MIQLLWARLLAVGQPFGLKPAGLGARDTLRTEACYPLYGYELDEHTTPIEAGVGLFVAFDKGHFSGRSVLAQQKANGAKKRLAVFKMTDKSTPPRPHYPIWVNGTKVGNLGCAGLVNPWSPPVGRYCSNAAVAPLDQARWFIPPELVWLLPPSWS